jgi:beta-phosphoglucomutase-like phosphatase (HAD superfamily)
MLNALGIRDLFAAVVGCDTAEVLKPKPHGDTFRVAAEKVGLIHDALNVFCQPFCY